jgi:hypothetical protein
LRGKTEKLRLGVSVPNKRAKIVKNRISEEEMIKGAQKKMIVIKTADSPLFEEAYFVLRRENTAKDKDIVAEANRIIENGGGKNKKRDKLNEMRALVFGGGCFFLGVLSGGCAVAAIFLI